MLPTKALYLLMKEAIPESITNYDKDYKTRLKTQKFIYLFDQICGDDLYNHSWYLAGPYSSTLTHQIYEELLVSLNENQSQWDKSALSDEATSVISKVKDLVSETEKMAVELETSDSSVYELVASIWYIAKRKKSTEEIRKDLLLNKPHFTKVNKLDGIIQFINNKITCEQ